jgi:integrase
MLLNDTKIRKTKPGPAPVRLSDGEGLYLLIQPQGGRWWRFDYRFQNIRKTLSLGTYPDVSLAVARAKRAELRAQVAAGLNPSDERKEAKRDATEQRPTFSAIAAEWLAKQAHVWTPGSVQRATWQVSLVEPWIGDRLIADLEPPELLAALRTIESRGRHHTAHRVKQRLSQVFRYAIATGRATRDAAADLRGALTPEKPGRRAALVEPARVGELLQALDGYQGAFVTLIALRLLPLVFVRPGELRHAAWSEIDFKAKLWRIPAGKMKSREAHIVPLSRQAIALLEELQPLTGAGTLCFPSLRTSRRPISENTINAALRRLGYAQDEMTAHGFRSIASTLLNELGWAPDLIERQLAHQDRNAVRRAYNRAQHLAERARMMQAWADYLDGLRRGQHQAPARKARAAAAVTSRGRSRGR